MGQPGTLSHSTCQRGNEISLERSVSPGLIRSQFNEQRDLGGSRGCGPLTS